MTLSVPKGFVVEAAFAIGRLEDASRLHEALQSREKPSDRHSLNQLAFEGHMRKMVEVRTILAIEGQPQVWQQPMQIAPRYDGVLFDLLTALLDSAPVWNSVAGSEEAGGRWLSTFLRVTYEKRAYRPYLELAAEASDAVGLDRSLAHTLGARYNEHQPWPGVVPVLSRLSAAGLPLGVVTNCSRQLAQIAANKVGVKFTCIITAEDAGWYKPDPRPI